ncbi:MAG: hypothetical protein F8N37_15305 [Telmatospirillum sp.]|nr:hypothetical protein [Telmatospirillum sp.]
MLGERDGVELVDEYRRLRNRSLQRTPADTMGLDPDHQLDAIYARIVSRPVVDISAALEKLWFAHHCLTEEDDVKEATNLVYQVCLGLEAFSKRTGQRRVRSD